MAHMRIQAMRGLATPRPFLGVLLLPVRPARQVVLFQRQRVGVVCQALDERTQIAKVADEPAAGLGSSIFSPYTLLPVALGGGGAYALGYGSIEGIALGTAIGAAVRAAQLLLLDSTVPFTRRRHTLLLPVGIELQMGNAIFQKQVRLGQEREFWLFITATTS